MPAVSLSSFSRYLDQLADRIKQEPDATVRASLLAEFDRVCAESRRLHPADERRSRGIQTEPR
jgi:hypothetical protein